MYDPRKKGPGVARTRRDICVRCDLVAWRSTCPVCAAATATARPVAERVLPRSNSEAVRRLREVAHG